MRLKSSESEFRNKTFVKFCPMCELSSVGKTASIVFLLLVVSTLLISCGISPEKQVYDQSILEEMGKFKAANSTIFTINTQEGFSACFDQISPDWSNEKSIIQASPLQGIYYGNLRVLAGWEWILNENVSSSENLHDNNNLLQPDKTKRRINGSDLYENIYFDNNRPAMLLEIDDLSNQSIEMIPRFDLRPPHLTKMNTTSEFDETNNTMICNAGNYGYIAIAANGTWIYSPSEERVDYSKSDILYDKVATHYLPGTITFNKAEKAKFAIAWSMNKNIAAKIAWETLEDSEKLKSDNIKEALEFLNTAPIFSPEKNIAYSLNWDRWLLRTFNAKEGIGNVKGCGSDGIGFTYSRYAPGWFWASACDTLFEQAYPGLVTHQDDGLHIDYERTALNTIFWMDYLELSGREARVIDQFDSLQIAARELDWYIGENEGEIPVPLHGRWEKKFNTTGARYTAYSNELEIGKLWTVVLDRLKGFSGKINKYKRGQLRDIAYKSVPMAGLESPIDKSIKSDPFIWTDEDFKFVNEALANPDFNLGYVEYQLIAKRDEKQYAYYAIFADRLWKFGDGLAYRDVPEIKNIIWTTPYWSLQNSRLKLKDATSGDFKRLGQYFPAEFYVIDKSAEKGKIAGGTIESVSTASERLRFLYESLAGINLSPHSNTILIAPAEPASVWKDNNLTLTVSINNEEIQLFIDPANGMYQVKRYDAKKKNLKISLKDLFDEGVALSCDVLLSGNGNFIIHRGIDDSGKPSLFLDGVVIKGTERRFHER